MTVPTTEMLSSKPVGGAGTADVWCWRAMFRVTRIVILELVGVEAGGHARGVR